MSNLPPLFLTALNLFLGVSCQGMLAFRAESGSASFSCPVYIIWPVHEKNHWATEVSIFRALLSLLFWRSQEPSRNCFLSWYDRRNPILGSMHPSSSLSSANGQPDNCRKVYQPRYCKGISKSIKASGLGPHPVNKKLFITAQTY